MLVHVICIIIHPRAVENNFPIPFSVQGREYPYSLEAGVKKQDVSLRHIKHFQSDFNLRNMMVRQDNEYPYCLDSTSRITLHIFDHSMECVIKATQKNNASKKIISVQICIHVLNCHYM
ncbi:hypothetical protein TNCT_299111 [Trichonephila clavata]|uniref:Uncharacterized protein n=1 Tax=Trichonephila clavata TaxID=2740835 RepID=A0A8X6H0B1_TRICU|nr:hypothetical protein TNCT_299111 [Trichonephila clavata]